MKKLAKKQLSVIVLAAILAICIGCLLLQKTRDKSEYTFSTTLPVCAVTEKTAENGYYLTVQLEDWTVDEYSLSTDRLTMRTSENIYTQTASGENYAGISLIVTIPGTEPQMDIGSVLKGGHTDYCEITAITTGDNQIIS